jgi:hypothetical protein
VILSYGFEKIQKVATYWGKNEADFSIDAIAICRCKASNNDFRIMGWGASSLIAAWKSGCIISVFCKFFVYKSWFVVMVV